MTLWRSAAAGSPHVDVTWRLVALGLLLMAVRARGTDPFAAAWDAIPLAYYATMLASLALIALGPRPLLLLASAASWAAVLASDLKFIADENALALALPLLAALSALLSADDTRARGQLWVLRMATLTTLGFAALHKFNADFLDPVSSCATLLAGRLVDRWSLPAAPVGPVGALALEAAAPLLLVLYPRLGALCLVVLAAGLGHVGPYGFNALLAALALAFLPTPTTAAWRTRARRTWPAWLAAVIAVGLASSQLQRGTFPWWPYFAFEIVLVTVAWLTALATPTAPWWTPHTPTHPVLPGPRRHRVFSLLAAATLAAQGLAPYLGLRYRYSFAMLSNLRVDDARWNHRFMPQGLRLRDDHHLHVLAVTDPTGRPAKLPARVPIVRPGVYSPQEFKTRLAESQRRRSRETLHLRYRGVDHTIKIFTLAPALTALLDQIPDDPLLQNTLSLRGRQHCVH